MRVISGSVKGRKLKSPFGHGIRPTSDKVKEAIFNILGDILTDLSFLDLYAGSGSIGIEALSRDAKSTTFIDKKISSIELIKTNLEKCGLKKNMEIIHFNVLDALLALANRQRKYDIIFIDPPYNSDLAEKTLNTLAKTDIPKPDARILVEHSSKKSLNDISINNLCYIKDYSFGDTSITLFEKHN